MSKTRKIHKLDLEQDYSFGLIGISSHENDYKLSWALNAVLKINLAKTGNLTFFESKSQLEQEFSHYTCDQSAWSCHFHLISNRSENGYLIPELKKIDYFLKITGEFTSQDITSILGKVKDSGVVLAVFNLEAAGLKSRDRLVF